MENVHAALLLHNLGKEVNEEYRYYLSEDFPYILGCYHGDVVDAVTLSRPGDCRYAISDDVDDDADSGSPGLGGNVTLFFIIGLFMQL